MIKLLLMFLPFYLYPPEGREMTDRLIPQGYQGNYWGPEACRARREGTMPPIEITPHMARWDQWGRKVLKDGVKPSIRGLVRLRCVLLSEICIRVCL